MTDRDCPEMHKCLKIKKGYNRCSFIKCEDDADCGNGIIDFQVFHVYLYCYTSILFSAYGRLNKLLSMTLFSLSCIRDFILTA